MTDVAPSPGPVSKIANSVLLQAISRLSMAGIVPVTMALAGLGWAYLNQRFDSQTQQVAAVSDKVRELDGSAQAASDKASKVATDLAVAQSVLTRQQTEADRFRADTSSKLDTLSISVTALSTSVAGLAANIADWRRQQDRPSP